MKSVRPVSAAEQRVTLKDGSLEFPSFMSPEQARDMLQNRLEQVSKRLRKFACANAVIVVTPAKVNEKDRSVHPGDIQYHKDHCQNDRRNGSRYCSKCAEAKVHVPKERIEPPKRVNYSRKQRKQNAKRRRA